MKRLTKKTENEIFFHIDESYIQQDEKGYFGDAITKLAKFEAIHEDITASQIQISEEMERLRTEGKTKTVKFRELMAKKLMNAHLLTVFQAYDL